MSRGVSVADPPRPLLVSGYEELIDPKGLSIKYTTKDSQVIPAFNFYPCLLELFGQIAIRTSGESWRGPFECNLEGVQWNFEPGDITPPNSGINRYIKGLSATIRKYQVPGVNFEVINRGVVTVRGSVKLTGQTTNELAG